MREGGWEGINNCFHQLDSVICYQQYAHQFGINYLAEKFVNLDKNGLEKTGG